MSKTKADELSGDIDELKQLHQQAKRRKVQELLSVDIRKIETELIKVKDLEAQKAPVPVDDASSSAASAPATVSTPISSAPATKRYQIKINGYGWDQSGIYIKVFVSLKNVQNIPKEQVYCKLTEDSMELHVDNLENKDYLLTINKLLEAISVKDSFWKQKTNKVVIFLAKANPKIKWSHMTKLEKRSQDRHSNERFYINDMESEMTPQAAMMELLQNIYDSGDDEMKSIVSDAWQESHLKKTDDDL